MLVMILTVKTLIQVREQQVMTKTGIHCSLSCCGGQVTCLLIVSTVVTVLAALD